MTKSSNSSSSSKKNQEGSKLLGTAGVIVIFVILAGLYMLTGSDPLGLFGETQATPVTAPVATPVLAATSTPASADTGGGDWWEVYFTDPARVNDPENLKGSIPEKLIELIDASQKSIHIAAFEFNLTPVAEALIAARKRGVEVQWITDDEYGLDADEEKDHGQFEMLEDARIKVRDDGRGALMHNKFWIFDGQIVWTGSTNITRNGNFRNNNNVLVLRSTQIAKIYEREFKELWAGESGPTSPSTLNKQAIVIDGVPVQVYFAAEDEVISHLIPMVAKAQKSIRFMAFSFTHDALGEAMLAKSKSGIDVQGIFELRASETEYSEMSLFYCNGMPVRQDGNPGTFHHKVIIIDDQTLITGSLNFSANADDSNDENVVVITDPDLAALYLQEFERRWAEASPPDKGDVTCK